MKLPMKARYCYLKDQIIAENHAKINVNERGFLFGDGVFETIRFQNSKIYNFLHHENRLISGLKELKINFNCDNLLKISKQLIAKNNQQDGILRIYISRGQGSNGYAPQQNIQPLLLIQTKDLPKTPKFPIILGLSPYQKPSIKSLPVNYKYAANLNSILVKLYAKEKHHFDDVILNLSGHICETASANIFWIKNNILFTPNLSCGALDGSIRSKIINLSPIQVTQGQFPISTLNNADEIFISNATNLLLKVDKLSFTNKSFLQNKYHQIFTNLLKKDLLG